MKSRWELLKRITAKASESMSLSPCATNAAIQKNIGMIYSSEINGQRQATRRRFVIGGLIATVGVAGLLADFLYGGPIRNALYPQNTTRGQEMTSLTQQITESSNATYSSSPQTYTQEGRLFFDKGTSQYGTAGNGIQDDTDSEPPVQNTQVIITDPIVVTKVVATATTDSSGDFKVDLPKGNYSLYPVTDKFTYMCQSVSEVRRINQGYNIAIGENNPKMSIGLMQGFLSYPKKGIDIDNGGYYDRDPRKGSTLAWNGVTGTGAGQSGDSWDNDSGTHFLAEYGDDIPSFAPGIVTALYAEPDNWVVISTLGYDIGLAHNSEILVSLGQSISRYQPIAKAGHTGYPNTVIHLQLDTPIGRILDPYKPVYPINPNTYGCWKPPSHVAGAFKHAVWLPLQISQDDNWKNYWIVEDQTHF